MTVDNSYNKKNNNGQQTVSNFKLSAFLLFYFLLLLVRINFVLHAYCISFNTADFIEITNDWSFASEQQI